MTLQVLVDLESGTKVLIDGILHTAQKCVGDGRIYRNFQNGDEILLSGSAQRQMALEFRLVIGELPENIVEHIARARECDFKLFSFADRTTAIRRLRYIRAVHELPATIRRRASAIEKCTVDLFEVMQRESLVCLTSDDSEHDNLPNVSEKPTMHRV